MADEQMLRNMPHKEKYTASPLPLQHGLSSCAFAPTMVLFHQRLLEVASSLSTTK